MKEAHDIVVLGTSAAGLTAALTAADAGADAGLFEKAEVIGGITALPRASGGGLDASQSRERCRRIHR